MLIAITVRVDELYDKRINYTKYSAAAIRLLDGSQVDAVPLRAASERERERDRFSFRKHGAQRDSSDVTNKTVATFSLAQLVRPWTRNGEYRDIVENHF